MTTSEQARFDRASDQASADRRSDRTTGTVEMDQETQVASSRLPATASPIPLLGLIGGGAAGLGLLLRKLRNRS